MSSARCAVLFWFWSCFCFGLRGGSGPRKCHWSLVAFLSCCYSWLGLARGYRNRPVRGCTGLAVLGNAQCRFACGMASRGSQVACRASDTKSRRRYKWFRTSQMTCSGAERGYTGVYWAGKVKVTGSQRGLFEGL